LADKDKEEKYSLRIIGMKVLISETRLADSKNNFYSTFDKNGQINGTEIQQWQFRNPVCIPLLNKKNSDFMLKSDIVNVDSNRIYTK
jgi:hypothetical protein